MNGRNVRLSPVSLGGKDWSYSSPIDNDGPYPGGGNRGQLISPPNSGGSSSGTMNGFPPGPRSVGGPSPPPSIGRSSAGTNLYARSESGRSQRDENAEAVLGEHYVSLRRFLSAMSRDGKPNTPPNKARDKLQRLTGVQFLELSTDVYDELKRREASLRRPSNNSLPNGGPPPYLLPEDSFHPKRNQARQKLSSLGPPRFRDLATDVFCELERRYPHFAGGDVPRVNSPMSVRGGPPSRSGTPVNGGGGGGGVGFPPRGASRVRRPSEASSVRSGRGGPTPLNGGFGVPPSPGLAPGEFGRPMPKQFQSNTIVPNKSTMVEEDDEPVSPLSPRTGDADGFGADRPSNNRESKRSGGTERSIMNSENDKKLIEDYEAQVRDLREKLDDMEDALRKKDDELTAALDSERSRASATNLQKKEWEDARRDLENKLTEALNLNDSLRDELDRIRSDHASETRQLRDEIEEYRQQARSNSRGGGGGGGGGGASPDASELRRENEELRRSLEEQQQVTEEVRREAQEFLREMKALSQQSSSAWERQGELERVIEQLEREVRDWRNRYARTKTQLRNMRASSLGLAIEPQDAGRYVRERGFAEEGGLVKDVHVTKFQIAIDELLRIARTDDPDKVIDAMKAVVVSVRRITKDIDESVANDGGSNRNGGNDGAAQQQQQQQQQQRSKLRSKVSSTANGLITASKNFAASAGISPVSLLDAAASHLVAAVVELLRTVKIRATPAGELEDDDDGTITPVDSTGFFSPRSNGGQSQVSSAAGGGGGGGLSQDSLPPPAPPFQGLGGMRVSADSSAYSPVSSPRESYASSRRPASRGGAAASANAMNSGYLGINKGLPAAPANGYASQPQQENPVEDVKIFLDDQMAVLVPTIQNLVQLIRGDSDIGPLAEEINAIADVVGKIVRETEMLGASGASLVERLAQCRQRLVEAGDRGADLANAGKDPKSREWRMWTQTLPPIAFEIARETRELVQRLDRAATDSGADEFA